MATVRGHGEEAGAMEASVLCHFRGVRHSVGLRTQGFAYLAAQRLHSQGFML